MSLLLVVGLAGPPEPATQRGDHIGGRRNRRPVYVFMESEPEPLNPVPAKRSRPEPRKPAPGEQPRKVTKAIIEEAVASLPEWRGSLAQARQVVPRTIPIMVPPLQQWTDAERAKLVAATRAYLERAVREYEAQQDEDDIELLLLAA